jgi:hypothetical protein
LNSVGGVSSRDLWSDIRIFSIFPREPPNPQRIPMAVQSAIKRIAATPTAIRSVLSDLGGHCGIQCIIGVGGGIIFFIWKANDGNISSDIFSQVSEI